jgi:hypothetical protein
MYVILFIFNVCGDIEHTAESTLRTSETIRTVSNPWQQFPILPASRVRTARVKSIHCTASHFFTCINPLTSNDPYRSRTATLTSKVLFYIFIQQIWVLNILNMVYTLRFFLFKMQFVS